jgi:hypothetical protein
MSASHLLIRLVIYILYIHIEYYLYICYSEQFKIRILGHKVQVVESIVRSTPKPNTDTASTGRPVNQSKHVKIYDSTSGLKRDSRRSEHLCKYHCSQYPHNPRIFKYVLGVRSLVNTLRNEIRICRACMYSNVVDLS